MELSKSTLIFNTFNEDQANQTRRVEVDGKQQEGYTLWESNRLYHQNGRVLAGKIQSRSNNRYKDFLKKITLSRTFRFLNTLSI
ncbi:MAG: hypothetical protein KDC53_10845 [Saprospiraceae bacterium]|nr:hypothetical protein [Saprospiraceae bacterium]